MGKLANQAADSPRSSEERSQSVSPTSTAADGIVSGRMDGGGRSSRARGRRFSSSDGADAGGTLEMSRNVVERALLGNAEELSVDRRRAVPRVPRGRPLLSSLDTWRPDLGHLHRGRRPLLERRAGSLPMRKTGRHEDGPRDKKNPCARGFRNGDDEFFSFGRRRDAGLKYYTNI